MTVGSLVHVMLVSFPGQGHVNPLLRLGKLIASKGLLVTFLTTELWGRKMRRANNIVDGQLYPVGNGFLRFEFFDDEWSQDDHRRSDFAFFLPQLELVGRQTIRRLVRTYQDKNQPVSCLVNNPFIPWVSDVAQELHIASAVLWVQSCACFAAYYHYHHRLGLFPTESEPEIDVQLPYMPLLKHDEIPSYLHPSSPFSGFRDAILNQFANLDKPFCVLIESFDALEHDLIEYMSKLCPIKAIGPLFKIARTVSSNVNGDICKPSDDIIEWLDSRPASSVVYISFGTAAYLKQEQIDALAFGVLDADVSFLWVVRPPPDEVKVNIHVIPQELKQNTKKGKIVEWCPQDKVLQHPSVACFLTHCGWNSTMEALTSGIPVICFPQWGDQVTNAVYLVDVFKIGVRLCRGAADERIVPREEVRERLMEATVGLKAEELRQNAVKWKAAGDAAVAKGGSSFNNFNEFVNKLSSNAIQRKDSSSSFC